MSEFEDIDAQELWQLLNLFGIGGYVRELKSEGTVAGGETPYSETVFWPIATDGSHVGGWWPKSAEVNALVELGFIEPDEWEITNRPDGAARSYKLSQVGRELADKGEEETLRVLASRGFKEHHHGDVTWGSPGST